MTAHPDLCVREGRLDTKNGGRRCPLSKMTGYLICPGDCASKLTPTEIEIRKGECINRGHRIGSADGWTREDWI